MRICEATEGKLKNSIQCTYHAWPYGLDGKLIGAPFMKEMEGFRWEDYPLRAAPVELWEGVIFIHLGLEEPEPFAESYSPLIGRLSQWNMGELKSHERISYDVKSNWKYVLFIIATLGLCCIVKVNAGLVINLLSISACF